MADYNLSARITADASDFRKGFEQAQKSLDGLRDKISRMGTNLSSAGKQMKEFGDNLTQKITNPAIKAASAVGGITLGKGFSRLVGIDTASAKLKALGHDAKAVEDIMNSALTSVKGTSYGLDEAATTAANAVAAGIKPGKELTRYLSLTADSASVAGSSMSEMGSIFNKVQTAQRAYMGELNQLADRGIPIYQWLADEAGVTADEVRKMASDGKISSEMFLNAIEKNIGGAAKIMGDESFTASLANIWASIGRIGANFLDAGGKGGGFFSTIKPMLVDLNEHLGVLEEKAAVLGEKFGEAFNRGIEKISELKAKFDELSPSTQDLIFKAGLIGGAFVFSIGPIAGILGSIVGAFGSLATIISALFNPVTLIAGAITGVGLAFVKAYQESENFRGIVDGAIAFVKNTAESFVTWIGQNFPSIWSKVGEGASAFASIAGEKIASLVDVAKNIFGTIINLVGEFVAGFIDGIGGIDGAVELVSSLLSGLNPVIRLPLELLENFGPQIAEGFSQIGEMIGPALYTLGETLGELASVIIPLVGDVIGTIIPIVAEFGAVLFEGLVSVLPTVIDLFTEILPLVVELAKIIAEVVRELLPLVSVLADSLFPLISTIIDVVVELVSTIIPPLIDIIRAIIDVIRIIEPIVTGILKAAISVVAGIIEAVTPVVGFIGDVINGIMSVISPIIEFIAGVVSAITGNVTPLKEFFMSTFEYIGGVMRKPIEVSLSFFESMMNKTKSIVTGFGEVFASVFNGLVSITREPMESIFGIVTGTFEKISSSWSALQTTVTNIFDGVANSVQQLVEKVKGFVNGVIRGVNSAVGIINKIPGVSISPIPQLRRGTDNWGGGFARINEGGRGELVLLPSGTQVIPHDVSMRYAREAGRQAQGITTIVNEDNGGNVVNFDVRGLFEGANFYVREDEDWEQVSRKLAETIERARKGKGVGI